MYHTISLKLIDGWELSNFGVTVKTVSVYTSMDSLFPQLEFIGIVNETDLLGQGILKFGTEIECSIFNTVGKLITKSFYCIYNIELINQLSKYSTTGTLRVSCVGRWYFRQMAQSIIYPGTPADALLSILSTEAILDYVEFLVQQSLTVVKMVWYRCNMTASKFIKTVLEPNYLIDESPSYLFANDLGQILSESYITLSNRASGVIVIDPAIITVISGGEKGIYQALGYHDLKVNLGDEYAWQSQAQRLIYLTEGYTVNSGGVEPASYLNPIGGLPPKLHQFDKNYYNSPFVATQVVMDDSANTSVNVRAKFLNTYRKKGIEAFQIGVSMDTDFRLTVGSVLNLRLTSLPQGNPTELKERLAIEKIKYPASLDDSILSGKYFIKKLKRNFISEPSGYYTSFSETSLIKCQ